MARQNKTKQTFAALVMPILVVFNLESSKLTSVIIEFLIILNNDSNLPTHCYETFGWLIWCGPFFFPIIWHWNYVNSFFLNDDEISYSFQIIKIIKKIYILFIFKEVNVSYRELINTFGERHCILPSITSKSYSVMYTVVLGLARSSRKFRTQCSVSSSKRSSEHRTQDISDGSEWVVKYIVWLRT